MKRIFKFIIRLFSTVLVIGIIAGICVGAYYGVSGYREYKSAIEQCPLQTKIESIKSRENYVTMDELPKMYIDAVIAVEDHNYYSHGAVSFVSTLRAIVTNIKERDYTQGGSTITQQVAKNLYFTQEKKLTRKVAEMFMAIELEKHYSKDEIFEFYVNNIYFGSGYYNIYDASFGYYGVKPSELTDYQSTILAGVPNAPSVYSPDNNSPLTQQRQQQVIDSMVEYGFIKESQAQEILSAN